jgi:hypothetical protein
MTIPILRRRSRREVCLAFPGNLTSSYAARVVVGLFIEYYNTEHRHSGIGLYTPGSVHDGTWKSVETVPKWSRIPPISRTPNDSTGGSCGPRICPPRSGTTRPRPRSNRWTVAPRRTRGCLKTLDRLRSTASISGSFPTTPSTSCPPHRRSGDPRRRHRPQPGRIGNALAAILVLAAAPNGFTVAGFAEQVRVMTGPNTTGTRPTTCAKFAGNT